MIERRVRLDPSGRTRVMSIEESRARSPSDIVCTKYFVGNAKKVIGKKKARCFPSNVASLAMR